MEIDIAAPCQSGDTVTLSYGPYQFFNTLDANGSARILVDAFLPDVSSVQIAVPGSEPRTLPITTNDLEKISKVAIVWRAPVNLDLHVLEYAARKGGPGHIWADAPSTQKAARRKTETTGRARGFLTMLDRSNPNGHRAEVYTIINAPNQRSGTIGFTLDYQTRADGSGRDHCGNGPYASITLDVHITRSDRPSSKERAQIPAIPCASISKGDQRYLWQVIPDLRFR